MAVKVTPLAVCSRECALRDIWLLSTGSLVERDGDAMLGQCANGDGITKVIP